LQEAVAGAAQFERIAGLEALALQPDPDSIDLACDEWSALDRSGDALAGLYDVLTCNS
jgi:hypothetical protein